MAGSISEVGKALSAGGTGNIPGVGDFSFKISTDSVEVVRELCKTAGEVTHDVCKTAITLGVLYTGYKLIKPLIDVAVRRALGGERDDQEVQGIEPGSLHVQLHCFTDKRFLEVLADYESGRMKERLQEEFSLVGIKVKGLKVEIENMVEVNKTKEAINKRYNRCFMKILSDLAKCLIMDIFISEDEYKIRLKFTRPFIPNVPEYVGENLFKPSHYHVISNVVEYMVHVTSCR